MGTQVPKMPVSDKAVREKTGRSWEAWLTVLDEAGAQEMTHREIAALITQRYPDIGGWWAQTVTVGYERARGLREKHETTAAAVRQ